MSNLVKPNPDAQLIELWVHGRSPCTKDYYCRSAYRFLAHIGKPLEQATLSDVQSFATSLDESNLTDSTRRTILAAVKSLLTFGNRLGMLPVNVGAPLKPPTAKDCLNERILSEVDVMMMVRLEPDPQNKALLRLLYAAGLRVSEVCGLHWRDLQPRFEGQGQATIYGKGQKTRVVLLPAPVWKELGELRQGLELDEPVFSSKGKPMTRAKVWAIVKAAGQRAGIQGDVSPHWLRHAHASHSLDRGAPIHLVQATLGHASVATTGRYLHARPSDSSSRFLPL